MHPETKFRTRVVDPFLARLPNCLAFTIQQTTIMGDPDKLLCIRGRFVGLEIKASGGRLRALQRWKLMKIEQAGGVSLVADPDNWEEVAEKLKRLSRGEDI